MHAADQGDFSTRQAHYLCEQALALSVQGDRAGAKALLEQAIAAAPDAARARIELARLQQLMGQPDAVLATLQTLANGPRRSALGRPRCWWRAGNATGRQAEVHARLVAHLRAIAQPGCSGKHCGHGSRQRRHLRPRVRGTCSIWTKERSLVAAAKWLSAEKLEHEEFHPQIQRALEHAVKP